MKDLLKQVIEQQKELLERRQALARRVDSGLSTRE